MLLKQKWFRALFRRRLLVALLIVVQAAFLVYTLVSGSVFSQIAAQVLPLISILAVLSIVSRKDKGAYKTLWIFLLLAAPILGGVLYLMVNYQSDTKRLRKKIDAARKKAAPLYTLPGSGYDRAKDEMGHHYPQARYLQKYAGFPLYSDTEVTYLCPGEVMLERLLQELEKAENYIFMEYFLIQEGKMWDSILDVLKRKAAQGVQVRLIYDDVGCLLLLPKDYTRQLSQWGIQCGVFNPFRPFLTVKQNNRDHRKIAVIDGKTAFTGGINLADEYANYIEKFGHWKDSALVLEGKAAWGFTLIFLEMWQVCQGTDEDFTGFYPWKEVPCSQEAPGFVVPYGDSPMDKENVSEHIYMQILNEATDYVYINTPYLILDDSVVSALCLAAKRGVDVRIVTPHIWDKWAVHMTTRSYYRELVGQGVKVYEYTKGFVHAKSFVSDDCVAVVGTANLDFRSLYLNFECGAWMFGTPAVMQVKEDFVKTLDVCQQVTPEDCKAGPFMKFLQEVLRMFAPLM